jgi:hypothetical protein
VPKIFFKIAKMATYVEGEAAETSSDEEQYVFNLSYMKVNKNRENDEK